MFLPSQIECLATLNPIGVPLYGGSSARCSQLCLVERRKAGHESSRVCDLELCTSSHSEILWQDFR